MKINEKKNCIRPNLVTSFSSLNFRTEPIKNIADVKFIMVRFNTMLISVNSKVNSLSTSEFLRLRFAIKQSTD